MQWLSDNWIWIALAVGLVYMLRNGAHGGCCGAGGHGSHDRDGGRGDREQETPRRGNTIDGSARRES